MKVQEDKEVENTFSESIMLIAITWHTEGGAQKANKLQVTGNREDFFPSSINNLKFLTIFRSATLQASMTASRGFRFSVGGWIKLDTDQFCVC